MKLNFKRKLAILKTRIYIEFTSIFFNPDKPILSMEFGVWRSDDEDLQVKCFRQTTKALLACKM